MVVVDVQVGEEGFKTQRRNLRSAARWVVTGGNYIGFGCDCTPQIRVYRRFCPLIIP